MELWPLRDNNGYYSAHAAYPSSRQKHHTIATNLVIIVKVSKSDMLSFL